jgi:hypothetical protein
MCAEMQYQSCCKRTCHCIQVCAANSVHLCASTAAGKLVSPDCWFIVEDVALCSIAQPCATGISHACVFACYVSRCEGWCCLGLCSLFDQLLLAHNASCNAHKYRIRSYESRRNRTRYNFEEIRVLLASACLLQAWGGLVVSDGTSFCCR